MLRDKMNNDNEYTLYVLRATRMNLYNNKYHKPPPSPPQFVFSSYIWTSEQKW